MSSGVHFGHEATTLLLTHAAHNCSPPRAPVSSESANSLFLSLSDMRTHPTTPPADTQYLKSGNWC